MVGVSRGKIIMIATIFPVTRRATAYSLAMDKEIGIIISISRSLLWRLGLLTIESLFIFNF